MRIQNLWCVMLAAACAATTAAWAAGPAVGAKAPAFELMTAAGQATTLAALQEKGPVVLVVLRGYPGYQCPLCTRQVGEFLSKAGQFKNKKASLVFVYPGPATALADKAKEFLAGKDLPAGAMLLLDPDYKFTKAYDLRWDAPNETAYPSTFVIQPDGKITFAKVSDGHGGRSSADEVLKALAGK